MRRVINGKAYDTETADRLCDISPNGFNRGDFQWEDTDLYRTPKGNYFIQGEGGARSRWAERVGQNGSCNGEGLRTVTEDEAKGLVERHAPHLYETIFGPAEEA